MFKKIAEFFTGKKPEAAPEAPYKVETAPVEATPAPEVDAVVIALNAVAPAAVVAQPPAIPKKPAPKKRQYAKKAPASKPSAAPKKAPIVKSPTTPKKPATPKKTKPAA